MIISSKAIHFGFTFKANGMRHEHSYDRYIVIFMR